jgi:NADH:ubiquinone oxidoreductase subunit
LTGRYIGDAKFGRHVGTDELGNRYFENMNPAEEVPGKFSLGDMYEADEIGRQRWIDYSQDDFNASQATPEWHSWLHGIRKDPPTEDPIVKASRPPWLTVSHLRV